MPRLDEDMTEPDRPVTRRELREEFDHFFARILGVFSTKDDLKGFATKDDLKAGLEEQRSHFDAVAESFTSQFGMLHDALRANTTGLDKRVKAIESGHGSRLLRLETRVTAVELGHPPKKGR